MIRRPPSATRTYTLLPDPLFFRSVMEKTPVTDVIYIIPRWQTDSGSKYAYSPATVAALPDARLIQEMTYTLLNAGQIAVRPPLLATAEAIRSDIQYYEGGITWVDAAYDERLGDALRPINQKYDGIPLGLEMGQEIGRAHV